MHRDQLNNNGVRAMTKQKVRARRVRDFLLYIVIGVAIAGLALLIGWGQATTGHPSANSLKWGGRAVALILVVWSAVGAYKIRQYKKRIIR